MSDKVNLTIDGEKVEDHPILDLADIMSMILKGKSEEEIIAIMLKKKEMKK